MILLAITIELRMILQGIQRRVVGNVLIDISPSNTFLIMHLPERFHQSCQAAYFSCSRLKSVNQFTPAGQKTLDYFGSISLTKGIFRKHLKEKR